MRVLIIILLCLLVSACMVGPNFHTPEAPAVTRYTQLPLPKKTTAQYFANNEDVPAEWWKLFHSPCLNALIYAGLTHSPNLQAAQAALREAEENWRGQIGNLLLPGVDGNLGASRQQGLTILPGVGKQRLLFNLFSATGNVSYLLDIWGGSRRQLEALKAQVDYQQFQLEATFLTLSTNIVTTTISIASLEEQLKATQELAQLQKEQLAIVNKQFHLGATSGADVLTQETQVAQTLARIPPIKENLAAARDALAVLIGQFPSELHLPKITLASLHLPKHLPITLPSSLVAQRPDIRQQEALLHAATAQVGVATANMLPQITLTGYFGANSDRLSDLFTKNSEIWFLGAGLMQPIFHGGYLAAQRRAAIAACQQAAAVYKQTVLQAFQNVADSLEAIKNDSDAFNALRIAENTARRSMLLTQNQYRLGGVSYLLLLNAQRSYEQTKINRIQAEAARLTDTAALFQALGGGWWNRDLLLPQPVMTEVHS